MVVTPGLAAQPGSATQQLGLAAQLGLMTQHLGLAGKATQQLGLVRPAVAVMQLSSLFTRGH